MPRELLRNWFERRLEPGDLEHKHRHVYGDLQVADWSKRIDQVKAELRRLCAEGLKLWGCQFPDGIAEATECGIRGKSPGIPR